MKCRSVLVVRCGVILTIAALACTSGCKSTSAWKMPSLFAAREPDADKLAGRVDTMPTSPASKYTPSAVASKNPPGGSTTMQTTQPGGLPYGNSTTASYSGTAPTGGLAAQANGYQTGPYTTNSGVNGANKTPTGTSNSLVNTPMGNNPQGFVSPYGGTYTGVGANSTSAPNVESLSGQLPVNTIANGSATPNPKPVNNGLPAFGSTPPTGTTPNTLATGSIPAYPSIQNTMISGANSLPNNGVNAALPAYPSLNNPLPSANASATASPGSPGVAVPPAVTGPAGVAPAVSAYQTALPAGSYAPGTTGRRTSYNFGLPPATATATPQTRTLPPNTALGEQLLIR